jgi:CDP-glucose 4,6-dehydratase
VGKKAGSVESVEMIFWENKSVFITGHTGFKGSWLCLWLSLLGAKVTGYALKPPTHPSLFELCKVDALVNSIIADVRDLDQLKHALHAARPEIVFHLAAQPIVRESYNSPVETFDVNVMGTVNVLEATRACHGVKAIINVTTDKVYENIGKKQGYREEEPLGGHDPYSSSKACSELVAQAYRRSYNLNIATARAGNVIGGGDWADDRLVPDFVRAVLTGEKIRIRHPKAVRPWQYVLEPLSGYLVLAERLYETRDKYFGAWNFGPEKGDARTVEWVIKRLCKNWGGDASCTIDRGKHPHEAHYLRLDNSKAKKQLHWQPKWNLETALHRVIDWTRAYQAKVAIREFCFKQIREYMA